LARSRERSAAGTKLGEYDVVPAMLERHLDWHPYVHVVNVTAKEVAEGFESWLLIEVNDHHGEGPFVVESGIAMVVRDGNEWVRLCWSDVAAKPTVAKSR
jgi:hypothetical protein